MHAERAFEVHEQLIDELQSYDKVRKRANQFNGGWRDLFAIFRPSHLKLLIQGIKRMSEGRSPTSAEESRFLENMLEQRMGGQESKYIKIYASQHPHAALADYIRKKMPEADFKQLAEVNDSRLQNYTELRQFMVWVFGVVIAGAGTLVFLPSNGLVTRFALDVSSLEHVAIQLAAAAVLLLTAAFLLPYAAQCAGREALRTAGSVTNLINKLEQPPNSPVSSAPSPPSNEASESSSPATPTSVNGRGVSGGHASTVDSSGPRRSVRTGDDAGQRRER